MGGAGFRRLGEWTGANSAGQGQAPTPFSGSPLFPEGLRADWLSELQGDTVTGV